MKKLILIPVLTILVSITSVFAQSKVGFVEYDYLLSIMPEVNEIQAKLQTQGQQYEAIINEKKTEMAQIEQLIQGTPNIDEVIRDSKIRRYQTLQTEIQEFAYTAQQKLEASELELVKPLYDKLDNVIGEVATAKGYDYVLNKSNAGGFSVVFSKNEEDNLTKAVITKLGLKDVPAVDPNAPATNSILVKP